MDHFLITVSNLLLSVTLSSSDQVILEKQPIPSKIWLWVPSRPPNPTFTPSQSGGPTGWLKQTYYSTCDISADAYPQPNNWLTSDPIEVHSGVTAVYITLEYRIGNCSGKGGKYCKEYFDLYVHQSGQSTQPDPLTNSASYDHIARTAPSALGIRESQTFSVNVKEKYIVLAFHDQGSCGVLFSVAVKYYFCPETVHVGGLVKLPRTIAPANNSVPVVSNCTKNAVHEQGVLRVNCQSDGGWNISSLKGNCICKEDMENVGGECKDCPEGKYNDGNGFNCTVIPSAPKNVQVIFVNRSALELKWQPPAVTGDQTHVSYDVDCLKPCEGEEGNKCVNKACGSDVIFIPRKDSFNVTHVIVGNLTSYVNYTMKIYAKNRVSEVARRKHGIEASLLEITVRTIGSVPGKPEVFVGQPEMAVVVTWTLKEKNGIIKEYHVTYMREDDYSETKTLATKKMEARFDLKAGKTYKLQVFAINQIGRGPAGVKNFTVRNNSKVETYLGVVYTLAALLVLCVMCFVCYIVWKRWCRSRIAEKRAAESTIRVYDEIPISSLHEYQDVDGFKLDRQKLTTVQVLGSGNFGQVCKAIYGPLRTEVAVKSLKDDALPKDAQDFNTELVLMSSLQPHPHVVKLIGCCIEKDPSLIVLEYLAYGDLLGYLRKSRGIEDTYNTGEKGPSSSLREKDILSFAWMIADGMNYLASMKIVHRDLAARNVLVGDNKVCKISDFGLARGLEEDIYTRKTQARLPIKWMPPESLFYGTSTTMSDVWSYGIVMWEVFTIGESPYPGKTSRKTANLLQTGYRMPRPAHISPELYSIMKECWEEEPSKRPTFQWLCSAMKRLLDDHKTYVNLEIYDGKNYVNFDMMMDKE